WQAPLHVPSTRVYDFIKLKPGQTISASVCARNEPDVAVKFEYVGALSPVETVSTPLLHGGMKKPTFEAKYYAEEQELHLLIHEPENVDGEFGGIEIFTKSGTNLEEAEWRSSVVLQQSERSYVIENVNPSTAYAVTVQGHVLPDRGSEMADPLEFEILPRESSVPRNVVLKAVDPFTVRVAWDPPAQPYGSIIGYTIEWSVDNAWKKSVHLVLSRVHFFSRLEPGQTVSALVCAHNRPNVSTKFEYISAFSPIQTVSTLRLE
ncbi:unnamed protein product, partial [Hydatigera taeniaeformis]|uniref:Fibronectin type-III domain-containing protein n=1 Tax=Hydatigena taeniaeformis TaxID=6205 RepID=A0A0R3XD98_HYDTA